MKKIKKKSSFCDQEIILTVREDLNESTMKINYPKVEEANKTLKKVKNLSEILNK